MMLYRSAPGPKLARLARPRASTPTSLAVIADPHVTPWATGTWKVFHRTEQRLMQAIEDANRLDVDMVVFAGDLTKDGRPASFDRAEKLLSELDVPFVAIPGNHDVPKTFDTYRTPNVEMFAHRFAGENLPFVRRVGGIDLVGIDTVTTPDGRLAESHEGYVSAEQLDWLESILPGLERPVVVGHHNLTHPATHTGRFPNGDLYQVGNAHELATVLGKGGVELYLSGHIHWPATATAADVREVVAPATCSVPQAFLHLEVDSTGVTVDVVPLADRAGFEEAYDYARNGDAHGKGVADCLDEGLLSQLPFVDECTDSVAARSGDVASPGQ